MAISADMWCPQIWSRSRMVAMVVDRFFPVSESATGNGKGVDPIELGHGGDHALRSGYKGPGDVATSTQVMWF